MILDLKQLFDVEGEKKTIDYQIDPESPECSFGEEFQAPILVHAVLDNRAQIVSLQMNVQFIRQCRCDRCLTEFPDDREMSFEHILVRELQKEESDLFVVVQDDRLDLDELVRSDVILELPAKTLCKDDCKGLCPECGVNRNVESCSCNREQIDPRLEALKKLIDQ